MENFYNMKIGDKVICVDLKHLIPKTSLVLGNTYTIKDINTRDGLVELKEISGKVYGCSRFRVIRKKDFLVEIFNKQRQEEHNETGNQQPEEWEWQQSEFILDPNP